MPWLKTTSEGKWGLKSVAHASAFILVVVAHVQGLFIVRLLVLQFSPRPSLRVTIGDAARNPPPNMLKFL